MTPDELKAIRERAEYSKTNPWWTVIELPDNTIALCDALESAWKEIEGLESQWDTLRKLT